MVAIKAGSSYFLSGVMQGKKADGDGVAGTVNQDYRQHVKDAVLAGAQPVHPTVWVAPLPPCLLLAHSSPVARTAADSTAVIIEPWDLVGAECAVLYPEGTAQSDMFKEDAHVQRCFGVVVDAAAKADIVISYLPEASMGSAVEIHAAKGAGKVILVVAPGSMAQNWVVRSYADSVFASIDELRQWLASLRPMP